MKRAVPQQTQFVGEFHKNEVVLVSRLFSGTSGKGQPTTLVQAYQLAYVQNITFVRETNVHSTQQSKALLHLTSAPFSALQSDPMEQVSMDKPATLSDFIFHVTPLFTEDSLFNSISPMQDPQRLRFSTGSPSEIAHALRQDMQTNTNNSSSGLSNFPPLPSHTKATTSGPITWTVPGDKIFKYSPIYMSRYPSSQLFECYALSRDPEFSPHFFGVYFLAMAFPPTKAASDDTVGLLDNTTSGSNATYQVGYPGNKFNHHFPLDAQFSFDQIRYPQPERSFPPTGMSNMIGMDGFLPRVPAPSYQPAYQSQESRVVISSVPVLINVSQPSFTSVLTAFEHFRSVTLEKNKRTQTRLQSEHTQQLLTSFCLRLPSQQFVSLETTSASHNQTSFESPTQYVSHIWYILRCLCEIHLGLTLYAQTALTENAFLFLPDASTTISGSSVSSLSTSSNNSLVDINNNVFITGSAPVSSSSAQLFSPSSLAFLLSPRVLEPNTIGHRLEPSTSSTPYNRTPRSFPFWPLRQTVRRLVLHALALPHLPPPLTREAWAALPPAVQNSRKKTLSIATQIVQESQIIPADSYPCNRYQDVFAHPSFRGVIPGDPPHMNANLVDKFTQMYWAPVYTQHNFDQDVLPAPLHQPIVLSKMAPSLSRLPYLFFRHQQSIQGQHAISARHLILSERLSYESKYPTIYFQHRKQSLAMGHAPLYPAPNPTIFVAATVQKYPPWVVPPKILHHTNGYLTHVVFALENHPRVREQVQFSLPAILHSWEEKSKHSQQPVNDSIPLDAQKLKMDTRLQAELRHQIATKLPLAPPTSTLPPTSRCHVFPPERGDAAHNLDKIPCPTEAPVVTVPLPGFHPIVPLPNLSTLVNAMEKAPWSFHNTSFATQHLQQRTQIIQQANDLCKQYPDSYPPVDSFIQIKNSFSTLPPSSQRQFVPIEDTKSILSLTPFLPFSAPGQALPSLEDCSFVPNIEASCYVPII